MLTIEVVIQMLLNRFRADLDCNMCDAEIIGVRASDYIAALFDASVIDRATVGDLNVWNETGSPWAADIEDKERLRELENQEPDESMDGDHDSAMASAGFGTDEDYGDFGGGFDE